MLPPESSASAGPSPPALPASSAATPTAPAPSTTSFARSSSSTIASQISSSVTLTRSSSVWSRIALVSSPTDLTAIPSAIVQPSWPAWTPTIRSSGFTARSASEIPDARPPPPTGITTVCTSGHLLGNLQPDRPLARDHTLVLVRVDERRPARLGVGERRGERLLEVRALELRDAAVALGRLDLGHRRVLRHEDRRLDPGLARGPRDRLAVVARACRDDAGPPLAIRERGDLGDGAADLERARSLQVLGLDADVPSDQLRERLGAVDGSDPRDAVEDGSRLLDLSQRGCRLHLQLLCCPVPD